MMKKTLVIHPFLFAIYFVLFLYAHNTGQFPLSVIFIPAIITTCLVLLLCFLLSFILKDKKKVGLLVSLFVLLFFTYGHFYDKLWDIKLIAWHIGRNLFLFSTLGPLFLLVSYFSIKTRRNLVKLTNLLNIVAAFLVVIPTVNIGVYKFKTRPTRKDNRITENIKTNPIYPATLPNIYYIILDAYMRADILKESLHYNNVELLDYLTQKGFYIANKSRSNYGITTLSLASSMNINYIQDLLAEFDVDSSDHGPLIDLIHHSYVGKFLKQYGYKFVSFPSGYMVTEIREADIFFTASGWSLNEFQIGLIDTSFLSLLSKLIGGINVRRAGTLYTLDHIKETTELKGPLFVFAHMLALHPPYSFGKNGEDISADRIRHMIPEQEYNPEYYKKGLIYLNKRIKKMVNDILSNSTIEPIIILQGDHGAGRNLRAKLGIFNAYYLPNNGHIHLYEEITPVNTFRIIFNHYFGANYELLKDKSYISGFVRPYKLIPVTHEINSDIEAETVTKKQ